MNGLCDGEQQKFEQLYNTYCRFMKYIALKFFSSDALAEDAVQNAFIKLLNHFNEIKEIDSYKTRALVAIVTESECKDLLKKEYNYRNRESRAIKTGLSLKKSEVDISSVEASMLAKKLKELDEKYRTVLMLKIYYSLSDKEIAKVLNISENNVRKRLQRARAFVLEILK